MQCNCKLVTEESLPSPSDLVHAIRYHFRNQHFNALFMHFSLIISYSHLWQEVCLSILISMLPDQWVCGVGYVKKEMILSLTLTAWMWMLLETWGSASILHFLRISLTYTDWHGIQVKAEISLMAVFTHFACHDSCWLWSDSRTPFLHEWKSCRICLNYTSGTSFRIMEVMHLHWYNDDLCAKRVSVTGIMNEMTSLMMKISLRKRLRKRRTFFQWNMPDSTKNLYLLFWWRLHWKGYPLSWRSSE